MILTRSECVAGPRLRILCLVAVALVCAVVWAAPYAAAQEDGAQTAALTPPLSVLWTFSMGPEPRNLLAPVVGGDRVFVSHGGKLHCLDLRTGAEQWEFAPEPESDEDRPPRVTTEPLLVGDVVIVGTDEPKLYALDQEEGDTVWATRCGETIIPSPAVLGDLVVVGTRDMVYGIDAETGAPRWACSAATALRWGPVIHGGSVYFLSQDGSVQAVDPRRGRLRWRSTGLHGPKAFPPVVAGGRVLVSSGDALRAVARTGATSWTVELPSPAGARPTVVGGSLFVPCVDGSIFVLSARSGWDQRRGPIKLGMPATSPPLVDNGKVMVGTGAALVYIADIGSGETEWVYRCVSPDQLLNEASEFGIYAPLVKADGMVLCLTGAGDLYCFSAAAGDPVPPRFSDFEPAPNDVVSGQEKIELKFAVTDHGSGVVRDSVTLTVDGKPTRVSFDPVTGVAQANLPAMSTGVHLIGVTARDYRGNEGRDEWSFLTDESIPPSEESQQPGTARSQTTRLGGGRTAGR